ncbi:MAG: amidohydrolase [Clostridia bacterium]|nr:amidohydrolase [Clostridia bacterium]
MNSLLEAAHAIAPELTELKDSLHRHPELAFREVRTTALLREKLAPLNLEFIDLGMETGVVALLRGGQSGKTVALRADIDGLPYQEPEGGAVVSEVAGRMHACGHDFHTAGLYGAARLLAARREELCGDVVFLFQPAEETTNGAQAMIAHGLWNKLPRKPDCLFGLHNRPEITTGDIAVVEGPLMAGKTSFELTFHGVGGHGGSPHRCVDVLVAAAAFIQGVQTIVSRNVDPMDPIVCGVCSIHGGEPELITDKVVMTGSIRAHSADNIALAVKRITELAGHTAEAYRCTSELHIIPQVPVTFNPPGMAALARRAAEAIVGKAHIVTPRPALGSEDFAVFAQDVPGFFYWLGVGFPGKENATWHNERFCTDDSALPLAAALLAQSALEALG